MDGLTRGRRWTSASRTSVFIRWDISATGLYLLRSFGCGVFGTGTTQEVFHSCETPQLQTQVEDVLHSPTELVHTGLEEPGTDVVWTCSLFHLDLLELFPHMVGRERQIGARGQGVLGYERR